MTCSFASSYILHTSTDQWWFLAATRRSLDEFDRAETPARALQPSVAGDEWYV
jgi:hypothetical protein